MAIDSVIRSSGISVTRPGMRVLRWPRSRRAFSSVVRLPGVGRFVAALAPPPGDGPSEDTMDNGFYECRLVGTANDGAKAWALIAGSGDPGNRATVKFVCESALALATERERLPGGAMRAGFLTPATAFGDVLAERLRRVGVTVECPVAR